MSARTIAASGAVLAMFAGGVALAACGTSEATAPTVEAERDASADAAIPPVDAGGAGEPDAADAAMELEPLRVVVMSDLNGSYGATSYASSVHDAVTAIIEREKPDVVLVSGDMVAGQKAGLDYPAMWNGFHAAVTDKLDQAGIPVAPAPGNHDASAYGAFASERAEYEKQWKTARVPNVTMVDGTHFPFRYSFRVKNAFFVAIDATTIEPVSSDQRAWIDAQLVAGASSPVRIVYGHVPLHPATIGRETEVLDDDALEALLSKHGAVFVGGHHHGYYPGVAGTLRHVVTPCLGDGPRALIGTSQASAKGFVVIDIAEGRVASIEARTGATYTTNIARASLPEALVFGSHELTRDDLAP